MQRTRRLRASSRASLVALDPAAAWAVLAAAGDGPHWYVDALPFVVRGGIDRVLGGRGRRWPVPGHEQLREGDRAGFWRVTGATGHRLVLVADVRSPGRVELVTEVGPAPGGRATVSQTVSFEPRGLLGAAYLVADLGAREAVIELAHRRLLADLDG